MDATDGYEFVGWNGSDSSNATIDITINSNTTLEAVFRNSIAAYSIQSRLVLVGPFLLLVEHMMMEQL